MLGDFWSDSHPSILRFRSGYHYAWGPVSFSHTLVFIPAFRPKRSDNFFKNATADGGLRSFPYPGFRFAPPGAIGYADLRLTFNPCGVGFVRKQHFGRGIRNCHAHI